MTFALANEGKLLQAAGFTPALFVAAVSGASYEIHGSKVRCLDSVMKGQSSKISFLKSQQFEPFCSAFVTSCRQEQRGRWLYICLTCAEALVSLPKKIFGQLFNENKFLITASIFDYTVHTRRQHKWTYSTTPKQTTEEFCSPFLYSFLTGTTDQYLDPAAKNLALKSSELHRLFFLSREPPGWTSVSGLCYSKILFYETSGLDLWRDSKQRWDQTFVRSAQLLTLWVYKQPVRSPRVLLQTWPVVLGRKNTTHGNWATVDLEEFESSDLLPNRRTEIPFFLFFFF